MPGAWRTCCVPPTGRGWKRSKAVRRSRCCTPGASHATPWLAIASTIAHGDLMNVMRLSRAPVDSWQRRWSVLQTVCDAPNHFHRQWLDWLGFGRQGRAALRALSARPPATMFIRERTRAGDTLARR
jgi:hypothetical protein